MDESMRNAVTTQKPVALFPKTDPSARCFYRLAENIEAVFERPGTPTLAFSAYWQRVVERQPSVKPQAVVTKPVLGRDVTNVAEASSDDALTQVQKQLKAKVEQSRAHNHVLDEEKIKVENETYQPYVTVAAESSETNILSNASENAWLDLRLRMNRFTADPNSTPEQIVTLLSSALYGFGERLGPAAVDLLHGLLHALDPDTLTDEHKQLLLNDYERLGLDAYKSKQENRIAKARYDAKGFGDQQALVQAIRSSASDVPLESLLESIKYASLIDSGSDR